MPQGLLKNPAAPLKWRAGFLFFADVRGKHKDEPLPIRENQMEIDIDTLCKSGMNKQNQNAVVIYQDPRKLVDVWPDTERDTVWLSQRQMAEIFDTSTDNIGLHLRNIYSDGELDESATTEESAVVRQEGRRQVLPAW